VTIFDDTVQLSASLYLKPPNCAGRAIKNYNNPYYVSRNDSSGVLLATDERRREAYRAERCLDRIRDSRLYRST